MTCVREQTALPAACRKSALVPVGKTPYGSLPRSYWLAYFVAFVRPWRVRVTVDCFSILENRSLSSAHFGFRRQRLSADHLANLQLGIQNSFSYAPRTFSLVYRFEEGIWLHVAIRYPQHFRARVTLLLPSSDCYFLVHLGSVIFARHPPNNGQLHGSVLSTTLFAVVINRMVNAFG